MSGGGGGGSAGGSTADPSLPGYASAPTTRTIQPTLPGFQNMLAQQLQAGFGSGGGDLASMLSSLYQPMTVYQFAEPITSTAKNYDASKNAPIATGNAALDKLLMGEGKVKS